MDPLRITMLTMLAGTAILAVALPASAEVNVGVSIGYPGGYGVPQPVQPFYGSAPVYVAPAPVYVQPPYYYQRDDNRDWREREARAAEWRNRDYHHDHHDGDWRQGRDGGDRGYHRDYHGDNHRGDGRGDGRR